jgi:Proteolysis_6 C-terminal
MRRCGKDVGIFINIRKCMILYLHNRNGTWLVAPYLDKHGEVDPCLRYISPRYQTKHQGLIDIDYQTQPPTVPQPTPLRCPSKERVVATWHPFSYIEEIGGRYQQRRLGNYLKTNSASLFGICHSKFLPLYFSPSPTQSSFDPSCKAESITPGVSRFALASPLSMEQPGLV